MTSDPRHLIAACFCGAPLRNVWGDFVGLDGPVRRIVAVECPECARRGRVVAVQVVGRPSIIDWEKPAEGALL